MSLLPLIIVNPASAGGATGAAWPGLASEVRRHFGPFEVAFTRRGGEAEEIAEREARAGRALVVACGGDGTINEVVNGILRAGARAELGVLPSGTGSDFRRTLKIPTRAADAARHLRDGETRVLDAGRVHFTSEGGEEETRFFLNVASFGMGGDVIRRVKERAGLSAGASRLRSEEHTSELQSRQYLVCRLLLEKKKDSQDDSILPHSLRTMRGGLGFADWRKHVTSR